MLARSQHVREIQRRLRDYPVVAILGARQVGKTTLGHQVADREARKVIRFDLESPEDRTRLQDPMQALQGLRGLVMLDEVQHLPGVFQTLRVLADRPRTPARFMVLGSASPELLQQTSESLAGRISYYELPGFALTEVGPENLDRLWLRGRFPRSYLATSGRRSYEWRTDFIRTYLERDLPQLRVGVSATTLRRFWSMLAHYHGQVWNASEFARALGSTYKTVQRYLDILSSTFVVQQLQPWHENLAKRQVKSPKVYVTDSGLVHTLLSLETRHDLEGHPKVGASWEGFLLQQVIQQLRARPDEACFWATHAGAELDLLIVRGKRRLGFEFKRTVAPRVTRSMHVAVEDLKLSSLTVIHGGKHTFPLATKIQAVAASRLTQDLKPLR